MHTTSRFQSTPGISAGRTCSIWPRLTPWLLFQSTPGISAGRTSKHISLGHIAILFQSTPGISAGRTFAPLRNFQFFFIVSIHTRHFCRANRAWLHKGFSLVPGFNPHPAFLPGEPRCWCRWLWCCGCFNPHPAFLPGEPIRSQAGAISSGVSIHTRHFCRANPWLMKCLAPWKSCFNPHPAFLPGEPGRPGKHARTPAGFNPHPAFLPGEPVTRRGFVPCPPVSIHTRHFCRANRRPLWDHRPGFIVSIHTRHFCRANP